MSNQQTGKTRVIGINHVALEDVDAAGVSLLERGGLDFLDSWGNLVQVVAFRDVQFSKSSSVLRGMGLDGLSKTPEALAELAAKGMSSDPSAS